MGPRQAGDPSSEEEKNTSVTPIEAVRAHMEVPRGAGLARPRKAEVEQTLWVFQARNTAGGGTGGRGSLL